MEAVRFDQIKYCEDKHVRETLDFTLHKWHVMCG